MEANSLDEECLQEIMVVVFIKANIPAVEDDEYSYLDSQQAHLGGKS